MNTSEQDYQGYDRRIRFEFNACVGTIPTYNLKMAIAAEFGLTYELVTRSLERTEWAD
jgi:hypothetical protein